jgi:squalene synthase HpnC
VSATVGVARPSLPTAGAGRRRARGENFTVASLLLGPAVSRHLLAIYDYARLVDDLGDEAPGDRSALLELAEDELDRAFAGAPRTAVFRRLAVTITACGLPRAPLARLIDANRLDQAKREYATFEELLGYCELSANPVGELVLYVFGAVSPERIGWSNCVCTALQLLEHWQDVGEDARRGRLYLPAEDRTRFGVTGADLGAGSAGSALRLLLEHETERAIELLEAGRPLVASLSGRARLAVAGYVGGGVAAARALRRARFDVLASTPRATRTARVNETLRVLVGAG